MLQAPPRAGCDEVAKLDRSAAADQRGPAERDPFDVAQMARLAAVVPWVSETRASNPPVARRRAASSIRVWASSADIRSKTVGGEEAVEGAVLARQLRSRWLEVPHARSRRRVGEPGGGERHHLRADVDAEVGGARGQGRRVSRSAARRPVPQPGLSSAFALLGEARKLDQPANRRVFVEALRVLEPAESIVEAS